MAAMYMVDFNDHFGGQLVYSADAKSMKAKDVRASYTKARKKGEAKHAKKFYGGKLPTTVRATSVRCVG